MATLFVVATPIGNLEDLTTRTVKTLNTVPVVACEDTRHTGQLIKLIGRTTPIRYLSIRDWNEATSIEKIFWELTAGNDVALVSDAGTPLISDPGFKLVRAARAAGFVVSPIPGPSAAIAALSVSGLPTDRFMFCGFWHKKVTIEPNLTYVFYESPSRINQTLGTIRERYPQAKIVLAAELTKIHERIWEWTGGEVLAKGEYTIVVNCAQ